MMLTSHKTIALVLLGGFILLSFLLLMDVEFVKEFDAYVLQFAVENRSQQKTDFFHFVTQLAGFWGSLVTLCLASLWLIERRAHRWLSMMWVAAAANFLLIDVLKRVFDRPRPSASLHLVDVPAMSYPSAHTLATFVVFGYVAYLIHLYLRPNRSYAAIFVAWGAFVLLVSASRVYLGVHYASDVVASWLLGGAILFALTHPPQSQQPD